MLFPSYQNQETQLLGQTVTPFACMEIDIAIMPCAPSSDPLPDYQDAEGCIRYYSCTGDAAFLQKCLQEAGIVELKAICEAWMRSSRIRCVDDAALAETLYWLLSVNDLRINALRIIAQTKPTGFQARLLHFWWEHRRELSDAEQDAALYALRDYAGCSLEMIQTLEAEIRDETTSEPQRRCLLSFLARLQTTHHAPILALIEQYWIEGYPHRVDDFRTLEVYSDWARHASEAEYERLETVFRKLYAHYMNEQEYERRDYGQYRPYLAHFARETARVGRAQAVPILKNLYRNREFHLLATQTLGIAAEGSDDQQLVLWMRDQLAQGAVFSQYALDKLGEAAIRILSPSSWSALRMQLHPNAGSIQRMNAYLETFCKSDEAVWKEWRAMNLVPDLPLSALRRRVSPHLFYADRLDYLIDGLLHQAQRYFKLPREYEARPVPYTDYLRLFQRFSGNAFHPSHIQQDEETVSFRMDGKEYRFQPDDYWDYIDIDRLLAAVNAALMAANSAAYFFIFYDEDEHLGLIFATPQQMKWWHDAVHVYINGLEQEE